MKTLDISLNRELQVAYVRFTQGLIARTTTIADSVNLDFDTDRTIVGIEFLADIPAKVLESELRLLAVSDDEFETAMFGHRTFHEFLLKD